MAEIKILYLTLKKKWFDMIASGEKKEEYREIKSWWKKRLINEDENFDVVVFRNGYSENAPTIGVEFKGLFLGYGKKEWGGGNNKEVFVIKLGKILWRK